VLGLLNCPCQLKRARNSILPRRDHGCRYQDRRNRRISDARSRGACLRIRDAIDLSRIPLLGHITDGHTSSDSLLKLSLRESSCGVARTRRGTRLESGRQENTRRSDHASRHTTDSSILMGPSSGNKTELSCPGLAAQVRRSQLRLVVLISDHPYQGTR